MMKFAVGFIIALIHFFNALFAETYYPDYVISSATASVTTVASENDCVVSCLMQPACSAISTFSQDSATICSLTSCANIQLVAQNGSKTIVFCN